MIITIRLQGKELATNHDACDCYDCFFSINVVEALMLKGGNQPKLSAVILFSSDFHLLPGQIVPVNVKNIQLGKVVFLCFDMH